MIKFIKKDFRNVREALGYLIGREIPMGLAVLYYVVVGIIMLPISIILCIYCKYATKKIEKEMGAY